MTPLTEHDVATALRQSVPDRDPVPDTAALARARAGQLRSRRRGAVAAAVAAIALGIAVPTVTTGLLGGTDPDPGDGTTGNTSTDPATSDQACANNPCEPAVVLAAIRKPLQLPTVAASEDCPVSPERHFPAGAGFSHAFGAVGARPLYAATDSPDITMSAGDGTWLEQKVIWVVDQSYVGALLLRGSRIDGDGQLRFTHYIGALGYTGGAGDDVRHRELAYIRGGLTDAPDETFSSYPSGIYVTSPGCYAIQVDGVGFSETLVFRALAP